MSFSLKMLVLLFIIVLTLFLTIKTITQFVARKYLPLRYDEVRSLVQSSESTLGLWLLSVVNVEANLFDILYGIKGLHSNCPFLFKIHLHPDCIVLTYLDKYAEVFKKSECEFKKRAFYTFLECVKNNKRYCIDVIGNCKQIQELIK